MDLNSSQFFSFLFDFQTFFELPFGILNLKQNHSGGFKFFSFLSFLFGFQTFFELPFGILNVIQNPSGGFKFFSFLFFSFLAFKPSLNFWNSECNTKSFRWICSSHFFSFPFWLSNRL